MDYIFDNIYNNSNLIFFIDYISLFWCTVLQLKKKLEIRRNKMHLKVSYLNTRHIPNSEGGSEMTYYLKIQSSSIRAYFCDWFN